MARDFSIPLCVHVSLPISSNDNLIPYEIETIAGKASL